MEAVKTATLQDALTDYLETYLPAQGWSPNTRRAYANDLRLLVQFLAERGVTLPHQLGLREVEAYKASLDQRGLAPASRKRKVAAIRSFLRSLARFGYHQKDLASEVTPPDVPAQKVRYLSPEEYTRLLAACRHHTRDLAIIELLLQTGIRLSELAEVRLADIALPKRINNDPENVGWLTIRRRKGGNQAVVPLNAKACKALQAYRKERPDVDDDHLFLDKYRTGMTPRAYQYLVHKYYTLAGIQGATVHTLRHTAGTFWAMGKVPLHVIRDLLGHKSLETTSIYLHTAKEAMAKAVQEHAL